MPRPLLPLITLPAPVAAPPTVTTTVGHRSRTGRVQADGVALQGGSGGAGRRDRDTAQGVARNDVASARGSATDGLNGRDIFNKDAHTAIGQGGRACCVQADDVALDDLAAGPHIKAVATIAADQIALPGIAATHLHIGP
jgi:hypothetical protein